MIKIRKYVAAIAVSFLMLMPAVAGADSRHPALDDTLQLRVGPFLANMDTTARVRGFDFTIDDSIDVDDMEASVYGIWRITSRLRLEAGYTGIDRKDQEALPADFGIIPDGSTTTDSFRTSVLQVALGYAFLRGDAYEFGADLGINLTTIKNDIWATLPGVGDVDILSIDVEEPLPTIGMFFNYAFNEAWYLTTRVGLFSLEIGDIDGTVWDLAGGIEWRPWQHVGLGLAYTYTSADVTISSGPIDTDIDYDYYGPFLYMVVGF